MEVIHPGLDALSAYCDKSLEAARESQVEEHLRDCEDCLELVADWADATRMSRRRASGSRSGEGGRERPSPSRGMCRCASFQRRGHPPRAVGQDPAGDLLPPC